MNSGSTNVDEFIAGFPSEIQEKLQLIRKTIKEVVPIETEETINYGIPTFKLNGNLVHYSAAKKHIGFYPAPSAVAHFKDQLKGFKTAKGSIQFPYAQPLPLRLIKDIVKFRVQENLNN